MKVMRITPAITVDRFRDYEVLVREITHEFGEFCGELRDIFILQVELIDTNPSNKGKTVHGITRAVTRLKLRGDVIMAGDYPTGTVGVGSGYLLRIDAPKFYEFLEDVGWFIAFEGLSSPPDDKAVWKK